MRTKVVMSWQFCTLATFRHSDPLTHQVMVTLVRAQDDGVQVKLKPVDQVSTNMTSTKLLQSFWINVALNFKEIVHKYNFEHKGNQRKIHH